MTSPSCVNLHELCAGVLKPTGNFTLDDNYHKNWNNSPQPPTFYAAASLRMLESTVPAAGFIKSVQ
jgi:hypothetical protein